MNISYPQLLTCAPMNFVLGQSNQNFRSNVTVSKTLTSNQTCFTNICSCVKTCPCFLIRLIFVGTCSYDNEKRLQSTWHDNKEICFFLTQPSKPVMLFGLYKWLLRHGFIGILNKITLIIHSIYNTVLFLRLIPQIYEKVTAISMTECLEVKLW